MTRRVVLALLLALAELVPAAHAATGTGTTPTLPNQFTPSGPAQLSETVEATEPFTSLARASNER